jgi:uroporphyrinogen decarboxylase
MVKDSDQGRQEKMNSRERVRTALAHREPDRVPIDLGSSLVTGINAVAYHRLKQHLGLNGQPVRVADIILQLAEVEEPIRQRFGVDVVGLPPLQIIPTVRSTDYKPWTLPDGSPGLVPADFEPEITERGDTLIRSPDGSVSHWMPAGTYHFVPRDAPLAEATLEDVAHFESGHLSYEELDFLRHAARRLRQETDYALFGWFSGSLFEGAQFARGWVNLMMDLKRNPEFVAALVEKLAEAALSDLARYLDAVGEFIDVIGFADDFGVQSGLQISPDHYQRFFLPYHRQLYRRVHARSQAYVFLHSCGSIYDLIPDLIEAGVDILNPVQTSAAKMGPDRLKQEFGHQVSFWGGGCCPQQVLPWGTPDEVAADVHERLEVFAPDGGYVFAPIHDIQPDVPPQNVVAMYDAVRRWGRYTVT